MPHLADGDISVVRSRLSQGERGVDETVSAMMEMAKGEYGARSPKIRALAINIVNRAGCGDKDYWGMIKAIHNWVRDQIRYVKDPVGQETLSYPEETAFNSKAGDCDDKTILEIAVLGSVGIRAWPVVIGVRPGHYSHVYLDIEVPAGGRPGTKAGQIIHADPIMREWELGREAPADKITQKKTYEHLAGLTGLSGHPMTLGAYASAPSYLDERNVSSVRRAMRSPLVDTASRGEILNAPKVEERNTTELDDMFQTEPMLAMHETPWAELGPEGPITGAEASGSVHMLKSRSYEVAMPAQRSFKTKYTPVSDFQKRLPGQASEGVMVDKGAAIDPDEDLQGVGTYIDSVMGDLLAGAGVAKKKAVVATVLARRAINRTKAAPGAAQFFLGELEGKVIKAERIALAQRTDTDTHDALFVMAALEDAGVTRHLEASRVPFALRVRLCTPLGTGDRTRRLDDMAGLGDLGDLGSFFKNIKKALKPKNLLKGAKVVTGITSLEMMAAGVGIKAAKKDLRKDFGDKWGGRLARIGMLADVAAVTIATGGASAVAFGGAAAGTGGAIVGGAVAAATTAAIVGGTTLGVKLLQKDGKTGSPGVPLIKAGTPLPEQTSLTQMIQPLPSYYSQPQYGGGYPQQMQQADPYGGQQGSPYAPPPVDHFGPQDMGPAEQSFDGGAGGGGMPSSGPGDGGAAPASGGSSWEVEAAEGSAPPQSPDMVDEDEGATPLPRARRVRAQRPAAPVEEEAEGVTYEVEVDADAPNTDLDDATDKPDTDVAGLGSEATAASAFSVSTLAVAGILAYLAFRK